MLGTSRTHKTDIWHMVTVLWSCLFLKRAQDVLYHLLHPPMPPQQGHLYGGSCLGVLDFKSSYHIVALPATIKAANPFGE